MRETRRSFLLVLGGVAAYFAHGALPGRAQRPRQFPEPPSPSELADLGRTLNGDPAEAAARKAVLLQNEREFRSGVERLYQLSSGLRDEVQKTTTSAVLSVHIYKKTEEIEKLAKQLKVKVRV